MSLLLMVSSPYAFADSLIDTGVQKFIAQPFHFQRGKFLAGTRDKAFDLMAFGVLRDMLPELGEGKDGFSPPF